MKTKKASPKASSKTKTKKSTSAVHKRDKTPSRAGAKASMTLSQKVRDNIDRIAGEVVAIFTKEPTDLISAIKQDHEGLRQYIDVLKDTDREMAERRRAYALFSALLKSHTVAEEEAVYKPIERPAKSDLVIRIEEGFVEHRVCDDIMTRMEKTDDAVVWSAHANVLAELVEHHLDEEEEKMFPLIREQISKSMEADLIIDYLDLRASTQQRVTPQNAGVLEILQK